MGGTAARIMELESALADARRAALARDEFVAVLGHELRTPLTAILLWSGILLREELSEPDEWREVIRQIEQSARFQQNLIDDLLDLARIDARKLQLVLRETSLAGILRQSLAAIEPMARQGRVALEADLTEGEAIQADPDRLQQVFVNLLANAIKFTPAGGRAQLCLRRREDWAEIRVADTGIGIAAGSLPRIFERFHQCGGGAHRRGGLGLGLAIAKEIVERHGGRICAESPGENQGTTFIVELPLRPELRPELPR